MKDLSPEEREAMATYTWRERFVIWLMRQFERP